MVSGSSTTVKKQMSSFLPLLLLSSFPCPTDLSQSTALGGQGHRDPLCGFRCSLWELAEQDLESVTSWPQDSSCDKQGRNKIKFSLLISGGLTGF